MDSRFAGRKILLLDGLTSQCLEYTKAFNGLGCDTTVLCDDRFDTCYASKHPKHKILGVSNVRDLKGTEEWILKLVKGLDAYSAKSREIEFLNAIGVEQED